MNRVTFLMSMMSLLLSVESVFKVGEHVLLSDLNQADSANYETMNNKEGIIVKTGIVKENRECSRVQLAQSPFDEDVIPNEYLRRMAIEGGPVMASFPSNQLTGQQQVEQMYQQLIAQTTVTAEDIFNSFRLSSAPKGEGFAGYVGHFASHSALGRGSFSGEGGLRGDYLMFKVCTHKVCEDPNKFMMFMFRDGVYGGYHFFDGDIWSHHPWNGRTTIFSKIQALLEMQKQGVRFEDGTSELGQGVIREDSSPQHFEVFYKKEMEVAYHEARDKIAFIGFIGFILTGNKLGLALILVYAVVFTQICTQIKTTLDRWI